ncbi:unnamed protein product [Penicillium olsonii]|uniref:Transcription factor domain-containing protein n=1 Tax=Penicillium olsonii TaxID=99116 RepID=A0A9W4I1K5_PENOL|nr:unnamed protein product [Penicillium olsonii]CAG8201392.1 unnamed protein product [Penicillium olsonii]
MPRDPNRERMRARQACRNCRFVAGLGSRTQDMLSVSYPGRKRRGVLPKSQPVQLAFASNNHVTTISPIHQYEQNPLPDQSLNTVLIKKQDRLADLERKVELILNRKDEYSTGSAGGDLHSKRPKEPREGFSNFRPSESERMASVTPIDGPEYHVAHGNSPQGKEWDISRNRESAISKALVAHGIQLYFERFHRQPIWCFDPQDVANPSDIPTELLYSILELTSRLSNDQQFPRYGTLAKSSIFIRVSEGTADIEIIESLCLLSYSAFMDGNDRLGKSYLGMGFQLCQEFEIDQLPRSSIENSTSDRQKRSFWSLQSLEQFYGDQDGILSRLPDIWRPYYTSNVGKSLFPGNSTEISTASDIGIWMFSVHFGWAWSRVREYVSECSRNQLKEPWHLDSTYAKVLADMTQIENKVPLCHRYDKLKFYQRQPEEVQLHQNYWSPWLKLQFTWHAILTTINHPFLYITASQNHPSLAIPNTFWRRSSELVLLHATWTVRLIDMIQEKGIEVLDPFFAHAAAIAATVHIYFSCAPDPRLKQKSRLDYEKCRKFMATFSTVSHASERLVSPLFTIQRS